MIEAYISLKTAKKVMDLADWKDFVKQITKEADDRDKAKENMDMVIQAHITSAISQAIPRAVYLKVLELSKQGQLEDGEIVGSVHIGPLSYSAIVSRQEENGTVSVTPHLDSTDPNGESWSYQLFERKPYKHPELLQIIATQILDNEDILIECVRNFFAGWTYDSNKDVWVENDAMFDLSFTDSDISHFIAIHIMTLLYALVNSLGEDDAEGYSGVHIPQEGTYLISTSSDGTMVVSLVPDVNYKLAIKNDRLKL